MHQNRLRFRPGRIPLGEYDASPELLVDWGGQYLPPPVHLPLQHIRRIDVRSGFLNAITWQPYCDFSVEVEFIKKLLLILCMRTTLVFVHIFYRSNTVHEQKQQTDGTDVQ